MQIAISPSEVRENILTTPEVDGETQANQVMRF
jgi:hypothetical protein